MKVYTVSHLMRVQWSYTFISKGVEKMGKIKFNLEVDEAAFGLHPPIEECTDASTDCTQCDYEKKARVTMRRLQIDLNFICNMGCKYCDRHLDIMPGDKEQNLSLEQLERMLQESVDNDYKWEAMLLLGGEPTLHPQFQKIVQMIVKYRNIHNKELKIRMASNGYSQETKKQLAWVRENYPFIVVVDTNKTTNIQGDFVNIRRAPKDRYPDEKYFGRCSIPCYSGLGFNFSGFYGCATGGATSRLFGYDIGIKSVSDLTYSNLEKFYEKICPLCGHWDAAQLLLDNDLISVTSSWKDAISRFQENGAVEMSRY